MHSLYWITLNLTFFLNEQQGSAEVVFARRTDAFQALKRYNNVQLDGRPMKIEIVGASAEVPMSARVNVVGGANGKKRTVVMTYVTEIFFKKPQYYIFLLRVCFHLHAMFRYSSFLTGFCCFLRSGPARPRGGFAGANRGSG